MLKQYVSGRVYIFIDAENLFYSQRTLGWLVSYEKLMAYFREECGPETKVYVYTGKEEGNDRQQNFLTMLERCDYLIRTKIVKKIRTREGYKWKNNLDLELALEAFDLHAQYDILVLVSGDSDFAILLDYVKKKGKRVFVMSTKGHISRELLDRAKYIDIKKLKGNVAV